MRDFLDRFVNPRLAAVSLLGICIWILSFFVAATGVILRNSGVYEPTPLLFFYSGLIGLLGICILGLATIWLAVLYVIKYLRSSEQETQSETTTGE